MIPALLAIFASARSIGSAILAWLSRRSLAEIACIIMALALVFFALEARHWKSVATQRQAQLVECQQVRDGYKGQLDSISSAKDKQSATTKSNIEKVVKIVHDADGVAKKIEAAPPTKDCKTAPEIMGADL